MFSTVDEHPTDVYVEKVRATRITHDQFAVPGGFGREDTFGGPGDWLVEDWRGRRFIVTDGEFGQRFEATGETDESRVPEKKPEPSATGDDSDGNKLAMGGVNLAGSVVEPPPDNREPAGGGQGAQPEDRIADTDTSVKAEDQNAVQAVTESSGAGVFDSPSETANLTGDSIDPGPANPDDDPNGDDAGIPSTGQEARAQDADKPARGRSGKKS